MVLAVKRKKNPKQLKATFLKNKIAVTEIRFDENKLIKRLI